MDDLVESLNGMKMTEFREKLKSSSVDILLAWKEEFDNRYYNTGQNTIDDLKYDILLDIIWRKKDTVEFSIGCKLREDDNKAKLPFRLGGMDKIKKGEEDKIASWKTKYPYPVILSEKLNGVSCLIVYKKSSIHLYTRGDGEYGADISYLKNKIKNLPQKMKENIAVRGELIIKDATFKEKWQKEYKNSLSLIVSVVNSKTLKQPIVDIEFLAYEIVANGKVELPPAEQFMSLQKLGFQTPYFQKISKEDVSMDFLSEFLTVRKDTSLYDIDGIIVHADYLYDRTDTSSSGNPNYAFAFKMLMEVAQATVTDVEWSPSKWGILKPRICITPIQLCGVTICHTTGFNGAFIRDNKINVGTKLLMTRSGDIIPYIVEVLKDVDREEKVGKMPDVEFTWNESGVDIVMATTLSKEVEIQKLVHFFVSVGVKQINEGVVTKLYENGLTSIEKIVSASKERLLSIPTFKDKMAERIITNLQSTLSSVQLADFLTGIGIFGMGIGKKKIELLLCTYPNLLSKTYTKEDICKVQGFSDKTAEKVIEGLRKIPPIYEPLKPFISIVFPSPPQQNKQEDVSSLDHVMLTDKKFVFSKFRDEALKRKIISLGGSVSESVSSKTFAVITQNKEDSSGKIDKARGLGIPIWSVNDFLFHCKLTAKDVYST
jgi:DNA ligase (NAD+)